MRSAPRFSRISAQEPILGLLEKLGLTDETHVVVYDSLGVFSSPRGVYTFKCAKAGRCWSVADA